jgi:hypothetical protein
MPKIVVSAQRKIAVKCISYCNLRRGAQEILFHAGIKNPWRGGDFRELERGAGYL